MAAAVLLLGFCALADYFVGSTRTLDGEWVRRLRVNGCARFFEHQFVRRAATAGGAKHPCRRPPLPPRPSLCCQRTPSCAWMAASVLKT